MNKNEILNILKDKKSDFNISQFILFGSYAKEVSRQDSDIDIAYILKEGCKMSFEKYLKLEEELTQKLHTKVDLMNFKKLNPLIKFDAKEDFIYV
ncbi:MAG: nucleotidyltransferase family protein [Sulfurimonas sp.]|jgi:predicted nucleotidyltransferase|uniref:type VII toxin-antitoxin system MntA family adenylyltransferase antitoxin n=1 Tax=Sulfurimonas sp. TaxID=2022749 RepID=UPI003D14BBC3